jgi:Putative Tad-like Flp pilus-assembly
MTDPSTSPSGHISMRSRRGQSLALVAVLLIGLLGFSALAIDMGHLLQVRSQLQGVADASALAAAQALPSDADALAEAQKYAAANAPHAGTVVAAPDVVTGNWDGLGTFNPGGSPKNAVRVVARRSSGGANPVGLFFARLFGPNISNVAAWATATSGGEGGVETITRFIIDEEIFKDPAKKTLEDLAKKMNKDFDWITRDNNGDWFIDIPPGTKLKVPTGQTGDEGLFDITHEAFPFHDGSNAKPTFEDFLNYNEDSNSWRYNLIPKSLLDPLLGVSRVAHGHLYPSYINPGKCQVSPVYKSDVSALNPSKGIPRVNALGWRNGTLAFSLDSIAEDPDGNGSVLPRVWITVCDPTPFTSPGGVVTLPHEADLPVRLVQ